MNYCSHAKSVILIVLVSLSTCVEVSASEKPIADILSRRVVCKQPDRFCAWPSICKTADGQLLVVFSGDRDAHICPWGKTQMVSSNDNGRTWSGVTTINNTPLDDRDAGIIETAKGTLIVNWFTSLYYERIKDHPWQRHLEKIGPETRKQWVDSRFPDALEGYWIRRSTDGGKSWSAPIELDRPYAFTKERGFAPGSVDFTECTGVAIGDKITVLVRPIYSARMWQCWSEDAGATWDSATRATFPGYAQSMLRTKSGAIVVAHRYPQYSINVSRDDGLNWDQGTLIDCPAWAMGAMIEVEPDVVLCVYMNEPRELPLLSQRIRITPTGITPAD